MTAAQEEENQESEEPAPPPPDLSINLAMAAALSGEVSRLCRALDDEEDPYHPEIQERLNERDLEGKSPLDMASMLGRDNVVKELLVRGADPNIATPRGYTALHRAASWGKLACVKILVQFQADLQKRTHHGERAREIAVRYAMDDCVQYLDRQEARQTLKSYVASMRETLADPEKMGAAKLTKEEKTSTNAALTEKEQWLENTTDASVQDYLDKKSELEQQMETVMLKISGQVPETPASKK
ncbi:ankyrin repeat domain-containing protein 45-like [Branchiostoma floridae x Branchiostoma japonicum]|uniref:Uncharacterized protein n=1 Tax=Branchiostoma floridae TaxID=7739 RepID=C3Y2K5_BRAFL|eukprot:XP_002609257.1 hypothetical protein BRAFLDRAFT_124756 [Branchiostoma floridae]